MPGWDVGRFVEEANRFVREQGAALGREVSPEHHLLSEVEVLALRLFTGPGFVPINNFLRQLAKLDADYRAKAARQMHLSYSSTCAHLVSGLRKLARFTPPPAQPLYRGVVGSLPRGVESLRDVNGLHVAVEFGFMSTSTSKEVCISYMNEGGQNVLWELRACDESDEAFHMGADVSMLSQFPKECEVTFPPYTMLVVERHPDEAQTRHSEARPYSVQETERTEDGEVSYLRLVAKPHFI